MARRQRDLIADMALDEAGEPLTLPAAKQLCQAPPVTLFPQILSAAECRYLIDCALPALQPAVVVHPRTGQTMRDPVRVARNAVFPLVIEDPVIHAINRRIAAASGTRYEQGEPLQVLCYEPGEEYKLHSDALPPGSNQRIATFLVWLGTDFIGGETDFPRAGLRVCGNLGDGLRFANVLADGTPDPAAWHAGLPVIKGRKLLLSRWIREVPLDLSGPPGRPY
jgi:prolyl 4-hydroxylase